MQTFGKLNLIAEKARQDRALKFTSLAHLINEESLAECYRELKKDKACGIDEVTVDEYGENLTDNLKRLVQSMKGKQYRPKPVRRVYIPKPGRKEKRGLGIPSVEDKIVQIMLKKILESIYEGDFRECSYGFRPNRSCHTAVDRIDKVVMTKPINYLVEVDIRNFFDRVKHYWLLRCIEERVSDPNFLWLIRKFLKAGIVEEGMWHESREGTPQGGVISPLLANIYLHYVLDKWFEIKFRPTAEGYMEMIRYCDDFVVCCESRKDAERFLKELENRFSKFGLEVSKTKTRIVETGRKFWQAGKKVSTFTFLGFTHYCASSRRGKFIMGHKTSKENLAGKILGIKEWLKKIRNLLRLQEWWPVLKAKLIGHYNYFGISGNFRCIWQFYNKVVWLVFKWMNRRSQKKSMNRLRYLQYLERHPLPKPKIYHSLYTLAPCR
ncbi:MAG: group II intron reverse transcriptase/maturase [Nitrospirae bacterium]|nr:group II intron reverse transcriptase/maturase [Nitrospirota bacterium]